MLVLVLVASRLVLVLVVPALIHQFMNAVNFYESHVRNYFRIAGHLGVK